MLLTPPMREAILSLISWTRAPTTVSLKSETRESMLLVTDAMKSADLGRWAGITVFRGTIRLYCGVFPTVVARHSIAVLELAGILLTMRRVTARAHMHVVSDNTVAVSVLNRRRSSAYVLHRLAKGVYYEVNRLGATITTTWVPSARNPADGLSRDREFSPGDVEMLASLVEKNGMGKEELHQPTKKVVVDVNETLDVLTSLVGQRIFIKEKIKL